MITVQFYGDSFGAFEIGGDTIELIRPDRVPLVDEMTAADLTVIVGPLHGGDAALELAGRIVLALEAGATVVFLYSARFSDVEQRVFPVIVPGSAWQQLRGSIAAVASDPPPHPTFRTYLVQYGQTDQGFRHIGYPAETLAHAHWPGGNEMLPAAFVSSAIGTGRLYVLPIHMASGAGDAFHRLVDAVVEHRDEVREDVPEFLSVLTLPGEAAQAGHITEMTVNLEALRTSQHALQRHKMLLSHLSGAPFEHLVIEELNLVLHCAQFSAADTIERFVEDFAIVDADSAMKAIGEAKAVARNIGFDHVDQLHRHRAELVATPEDDGSEPGRLPTDTPGLLVVNTFRNDNDLARRNGEGVHERVARYARLMNVLILRSADLFQLVVRKLEGQDDAETLANMILESGGGWLEVETELNLHQG